MSNKKRDLADAMETDLSDSPVIIKEPEVREAPKKHRTVKPPSRENTNLVGAHFDVSVGRQVEMLRAELQIDRQKKVTLKTLLAEAINLLFKKHGKAPIAQ